MERSLINEFKGSNSTLFHSTVLGTTSLLQRPKETDLYKSRITHLPSDPKIDLTRKIDFVVVFQAIEIERLGQELVGLKGRLRETEGRGLHQASYEVQIRELMERCSKIQSEKYSYRQELAQTKAASESIFNQLSLLQGRYSEVDFCAAEKYKLEKARGEELVLEIQKWKGRYSALERAKIEEQEGLRRMMDAQKEALGNREIKDLMNRFQLEKEELLMRLRERKEQLDEKELQLKKLQNYYEQLQVRSREDESKIDSYEQKVAMLSQQTIRLSQLVRAKSEQIRNLKLISQQDFSLKISQINSLDQTKHQLSNRLQIIQDENDQLRHEGKALMEQNAHMKRKLVEVDRLEFQLREAREDCENKLKSMERKDKKIITLEEQIKNSKKVQQEVKRLKASNLKLQKELQELQQILDSKINQLRQIKEEQTSFIRWRENYNSKVQTKLNEFTNAYQTLQRQNVEIRIASQKNLEKSTTFELKAKQFALQMKQKDYIINSLQNQIRQQEANINTKEVEANSTIQQLESQFFTERRKFEVRLQQSQGRRRQREQIIRQAESRARDAQQKLRESQHYQIRVRSLEAECSDLELWGRSLQQKNHQLELHITDLEAQLLELEDQSAEWRGIVEGQATFYRQVQSRYFQNAQELKTIKARLENIEKILITLKTTIGLRLKNAHEQDRRLHTMQQRYQQLFQWFISVSGNSENGLKDSPTKQSYNGFFGNFGSNQNSRYSTSIDRSSLSPLHRARSSERTRENINSGNNRQQQPSIEAAMRHVLLCAQVQSLRKRVGDKHAKVQSMRNSIVTKGFSQTNGFFTARETSANKKNIYY